VDVDQVMMMEANRPGGGEIHSDMNLVLQHYCSAYRMEELKMFHCERVRKMPMSGVGSDMLIGFLVP
jgi:hypothetical protein